MIRNRIPKIRELVPRVKQVVPRVKESARQWFNRIMERDGYLVEAQNSICAIIVGFVFLANTILDGNLYGRFPNTYRYMEHMPSWFWAIIFITLGTIHLIALSKNSRYWRKEILIVKAGMWIFLSICVLTGDSYAASGWIYIIFAVIATRSYLRIHIYKGGSPTNGTVSNAQSGS